MPYALCIIDELWLHLWRYRLHRHSPAEQPRDGDGVAPADGGQFSVKKMNSRRWNQRLTVKLPNHAHTPMNLMLLWLCGVTCGSFLSSRGSSKQEENRTGGAEMRGGKGSFTPASIFPSSDLWVSASPVRCFLL